MISGTLVPPPQVMEEQNQTNTNCYIKTILSTYERAGCQTWMQNRAGIRTWGQSVIGLGQCKLQCTFTGRDASGCGHRDLLTWWLSQEFIVCDLRPQDKKSLSVIFCIINESLFSGLIQTTSNQHGAPLIRHSLIITDRSPNYKLSLKSAGKTVSK